MRLGREMRSIARVRVFLPSRTDVKQTLLQIIYAVKMKLKGAPKNYVQDAKNTFGRLLLLVAVYIIPA
jgi:hypothetical protein